jgi:cytochrome c-type biogenesis protein CcmH/NrfG
MSKAHNSSTPDNWTAIQAYTLSVLCLAVGITAGWLLRGSQSAPAAQTADTPGMATAPAMGAQPTPEQMKKMADVQAASLLEQLKANPDSPELLVKIGNIYYDTQQYPTAIDFYQRSLKLQPSNASVRTDMATAYWYIGNADTAIEQFNQALASDPNNANTLFNLGVVKWQGKMDIQGAVSSWQKLLATNPKYENRDKVEQLIAEAQKHSDVKAGTKTKPISQ